MIESKYHYEKVWQMTSDKDLERIIAQELPEAPLKETLEYVKKACEAGQTVNFATISFRQKPQRG